MRRSSPELHSLTGAQVALLRKARDKSPEGAYVPISGCPGADELVAGGVAEYREVRRTSDTARVDISAKYEWTDLVPTPRGLELLDRAGRAAREARRRLRSRSR